MALFDIFRKSKQKEDRLKRPPKGAFKKSAFAKPARQSGGASAGKLAHSVEVSTDVKPARRSGGTVPDKSAGKPATAKIMTGKEKSSDLASIVFLSPHITEKTAIMAEGNNVYAFRVSPRVNKITAERAFRELYGFNPLKVRILNMPSKKRIVRGRVGMKSGFKKALIYLKKGDKIELA
ncbi:MAG: 50S ribosomal protein L23 [bacterium]|nr:50S ribosomal protein L23 [bacterium]